MTSDKIRVVCFGGGTGLPTLLSGIKANPFFEISAIVTMFDTGGSSGKLKDKFGILPPGDILKCILALSKNEQATREIFLKRITDINYPGHTGGNILLLGLEKVYGSLTTAINALGEILSASKKADILIMGPGSFYTSLLPNFLPQGVKEAIKESEAKTIYVCNLLTEGYGMKNYKMDTFIKTVESYAGRKIDRVIANSHIPSKRLGEYAAERKYPVKISGKFPKNKIVAANLWTDSNLARHDQKKLSYLIDRVVFSLLNL